MKKYIFAAVFLLLALIIIFTADNHVDAQTETPLSTTSVTAAELPPPQLTTTTVTTFPPTAETTTSAENYGAEIVRTAEALMGIDFKEGGDEPSEGFDNSGFIYYVLRENGYISFPRKIKEQIEWGPSAEYNEIKAGDILYFSDEPGEIASFGGIYAGNGVMIYCPYPGEKVKTADITAHYWQSRFVTAISL